MSKPPPSPAPQMAHFEVLRRLGVGGMAEVFLAKKRGAENTFKLLVLKRVLPAYGASSRFRAMFAEEANLATRLNHPNIVQVYEFQDYADEGQLLSMEYVEGLDLGKLMSAARTKGTLIPPWVAAHIVAEAAKGLHYAHERKDERGAPLDIVHRDVSPQNVLLSYEGAVKIADFGVATANMFRDEVGVLKGKFGYMSPEQARGERVDRRSDIYALGVILHEMLTSRALHPGLSGEDLLAAVRIGNVEPPSQRAQHVPPDLDSIVMRALSARREERFSSARDMAGAVARAMMQRQVLVDASVLEATVEHLVGREHTSPGLDANASTGSASASLLGNTVAAIRGARVSADASSAGSEQQTPAPEPTAERHEQRMAREVRHVAVVTLRLHGLVELEQAAGAARIQNDIRTMLEQLAFKRGATLTWTATDRARTTIGLMANPSRATTDAASLAVDIHEFLDDSSDDWPVRVQASIGMVRGIASGKRDRAGHLMEHTLQAPAEGLAGILGDKAPPGRTWGAGGIYRLVRDDFVWHDASTIEFEGTDELNAPRSLRVHELVRPLSREEREARRAGNLSDLIGRDAEKADLHSALHQASQASEDRPRVVARVIIGEMGIGKSALVTAFLNELSDDVAKIYIDCSPAQSELPLGAAAELIRTLTGTSTDQTIEDAHRVVFEALGNDPAMHPVSVRLAELASGKQVEHFDDEDVAYGRKLVVGGIRRIMSTVAQQRQLVVVVDSFQWADQVSLGIFEDLLGTQAMLPLLVLVVMRPEDRVLPIVERLVHIELRGLRPDEQVRLVAGRLGVQEGVANACSDLIPRVAGNPFFLLEMVDALLERGSLEIREQDGKHALARVQEVGVRSQPLPSTLEQLIADRLLELSGEERQVVQWLAVAGGPLSPDDLHALVGPESDEHVARLCARGMCDRRADVIDFRHPIARDVAYDEISQQARVTMHRGLGEHLATTPLAQGLTAVIVARHLARGRLFLRAAELYLEAGQAARTGYQTQLAVRYFHRALSLLDENDFRRLRVHEALEGIYRLLGRHRSRTRHLAALRKMARQSAHPQWVALALTRTAVFSYDENLFSKCVSLCHQAADAARMARMPHLEVESLSTLGEALRELGDVQGALSACDRALEVAKDPQVSPRIRADVLRSRGVLLRRVGRVREAVDCYVESIAVFRRVGARRPEARATNALAFAMFVLERFEDSIALALQSIAIDLAIGGRFQLAKTLANIGQAYARLGDLPRAMAYLERARDAHERFGDQDSRADTLIVSAEVMLESGDPDAARSFCLDAAALTSVTASAYDDVHEKIVRATLDRAVGDPGSAIMRAVSARQAAEAQALVSFYCYATAVEAAARIDIGELHTGILLATTALGSMTAVQGSEYGLEVCYLCWDALLRAGSPQARDAAEITATRALRMAESIRDQRLKSLFFKRPQVQRIIKAVREVQAASASAIGQPRL